MQQATISIPHADSTIKTLNAMGNKSTDKDEIDHYDQESTLYALRILAMSILSQHLLELTYIEEPDTHERPIRKISLYPESGNVNLLVRSNNEDHLMEFKISSSTKNLDDFVWPLFSINGNHGSRKTINKLTYLKLILDLLALDDYSPEAIDAYAESQHDWCLSSSFISGMSRNIYSLHLPFHRLHHKNDEVLARLVVSALIQDCRALPLDSDFKCSLHMNADLNHYNLVSASPNPEPPIIMIDGELLGNYDHRHADLSGGFTVNELHWETTCDFIKEVEVSSSVLYSNGDGCYDTEAIEMSGLGSILKTPCGLHEIQPYRKVLESKDELGESTIIDHYLQANDGAGVFIYDRLDGIIDSVHHWTYCDTKWPDRVDPMLRDYDAGVISYKPDVPVGMRSEVTRKMLVDLESEIHFIRRTLLRDALGINESVTMEKILGEDDSIDPEFLADFIANGFLTFDRYFLQYFHSRQSSCFGVPSAMLNHPEDVSDMLAMNSVLDFGCTAISRKTNDLTACYEIAGYYDSESKEHSEPEARYLAFMKMYLLHLMVRFPDTIASGGGDGFGRRVTPFEQFVMDDVLRSVMAAYESGVLSLDEDSNWYGEFADDCLNILIGSFDSDLNLLSCETHDDEEGEGVITGDDDLTTLMIHHSGLIDPRGGSPLDNRQPEYVKIDSMVASHVKELYRRMLDGGDLHWMDEAFGQLDDVLVDAIIDHYLTRLDVGSGSSLPDRYVLETLRMNVINNYEEVGLLICSNK